MNLQMTIFLTIVTLLIYGSVNIYVAKRVYEAVQLSIGKVNLKVYTGGMCFLALILILKFLLMSVSVNSEAKQIVNWIASYWLGFMIYLLLFFILSDLLLLAGRGLGLIHMNHFIRLHVSFIAVMLASIICCIGIFNAKKLQHVSYVVKTVHGTISEDVNIVLLSDLHLGAVDWEKRLERTVQKVNELNADIICIAGDIFDSDFYEIQNPQKACKLLQDMRAKNGVYACLGNHDAGSTFTEMQLFLEESGIKCLKEEYVVIGNQFILTGRLDSHPIGDTGFLKRGNISDILKDADKNLPVVVMDHNPANIGEYKRDVDLILCGHTHHGQIWPGKRITDALFQVAYGHYQKNQDSPHVIVSSGAGLWGMPMRLGSRCEVVSVYLKSK